MLRSMVRLLGAAALATTLLPTPVRAQAADNMLHLGHFVPRDMEISFGESLVFADQPLLSVLQGSPTSHVYPVNSALFLAEWLFHSSAGAVASLNWPLQPVRRLVEGRFVEEYVAPTV